MSTATDELTDLEQSLDETIPCEQEGCEVEALWRGALACCGEWALKCTWHKVAFTKRWDETVQITTSYGNGWKCGHCAAFRPPPPIWTRL